MRNLIVNADDFGLARGVNEGIVEAHVNGILTSTSLMVLRPTAPEAAVMASSLPELSVGLHFEDDGSADLDDPTQVARAFRRQLERFRALMGRGPTHVDSHHHVHAEGDRLATFVRLVAPLGIPLRHNWRVAYIGGFWGQPDQGRLSASSLHELIDAQVGDGFSELGCHPARITPDLKSSYVGERAIELVTLTQPEIREQIESGGVTLASFHAWRP